jgi:RNA processing factor Prp31
MNLPQVEASVVDLSKFATVVKLVAFNPFQSGVNALDNINAISEGLVHDDLRTFLDTNLPKEKKRAKMILGVADSRIASAINELFTITCQHTGVVPELLRGKMNEKKNTSIVCFSRSATSFSKFSQRFN